MAIVQFRCDDKLKSEATKVFAEIGLDLSSALRLFLVKSVAINGLPFNPNKENKISRNESRDLVDFEELSIFQDGVKPDKYNEF